MRIISFAWTTPAVIARRKTVTRRDWPDHYAARFRAGDLVQAFNRSPRHHGERVATIRLTRVYKEPLFMMPDEDYEGEGFAYLAEHPHLLPKTGPFSDPLRVSREAFAMQQKLPAVMWVVRFEVESIEGEAA